MRSLLVPRIVFALVLTASFVVARGGGKGKSEGESTVRIGTFLCFFTIHRRRLGIQVA